MAAVGTGVGSELSETAGKGREEQAGPSPEAWDRRANEAAHPLPPFFANNTPTGNGGNDLAAVNEASVSCPRSNRDHQGCQKEGEDTQVCFALCLLLYRLCATTRLT